MRDVIAILRNAEAETSANLRHMKARARETNRLYQRAMRLQTSRVPRCQQENDNARRRAIRNAWARYYRALRRAR